MLQGIPSHARLCSIRLSRALALRKDAQQARHSNVRFQSATSGRCGCRCSSSKVVQVIHLFPVSGLVLLVATVWTSERFCRNKKLQVAARLQQRQHVKHSKKL